MGKVNKQQLKEALQNELDGLRDDLENIDLSATSVMTSSGKNVQEELDTLKLDTDNKVLSVRDAIISKGGTVTAGGEVPTAGELVAGVEGLEILQYEAGESSIFSNTATVGTANHTFSTVRNYEVLISGNFRIKYNVFLSSSGNEAYARLLVNGEPQGSNMLTTADYSPGSRTNRDLSLNAGDTLTLQLRVGSPLGHMARNDLFSVNINLPPVVRNL